MPLSLPPGRHPMQHRHQNGFTLLELLVVIAIAAVLTGVAIPSFQVAMRNAQSRAAATDFYSALNRARSEAIARNATVSVCARDPTKLTTPTCLGAGSTAWRDGWMVYANAAPTVALAVGEVLPEPFTLGAVASPVSFDANGRATNSAQFDLCHRNASDVGRRLVVSRSGRVSLEARPC